MSNVFQTLLKKPKLIQSQLQSTQQYATPVQKPKVATQPQKTNTDGYYTYGAAFKPKITPRQKAPPIVPPTTVTQPPAPTSYQQQYQDYLKQSQIRQEDQARLQNEEDRKTAEENYGNTKQGLLASQSNLDQLLGGIRERSAASSARLNTVADQNKTNVRDESGENQRQLMETRREQLADQEKRYAALGTIDSYGTGSFQSANENVENDFLRTTAKNKRATEQKLADVDNKLFDAKANVEASLAQEESKYNDAVVQINSLLAGNEVERNQLLRQAALKYSGAKATILDQYEQLRLQGEKEKADAQAKLDEAGAMDQKLMEVMKSASPEFLKTGQPKTAQDQFIIFKYPKEAEAYMKMLTAGQTLAGGAGTEVDETIDLIDQVSARPLGPVTGAMQLESMVQGTQAFGTKRLIQQIKDKLALAARGQLKGQGQISNFEADMLRNAVTALDSGMGEEDFKAEMAKVRGILDKKRGGTGSDNQQTNNDPLGLF